MKFIVTAHGNQTDIEYDCIEVEADSAEEACEIARDAFDIYDECSADYEPGTLHSPDEFVIPVATRICEVSPC